MAERGYGRVVNIASVLGQVPLRNQAPYAAAKAAIINLTRSMAMELAPYNILVNCISPGSVSHDPGNSASFFYGDAEKTKKLLEHIPLHRTGRPEEIAKAAMFLSSDDIGYMTGNNITVDGGWISGDLYAG
jgi:NAD(P)-dependent dehydrogenase (short-subunit alcohol dehydrogenase family)